MTTLKGGWISKQSHVSEEWCFNSPMGMFKICTFSFFPRHFFADEKRKARVSQLQQTQSVTGIAHLLIFWSSLWPQIYRHYKWEPVRKLQGEGIPFLCLCFHPSLPSLLCHVSSLILSSQPLLYHSFPPPHILVAAVPPPRLTITF